jgi:hypothetical protein
MGVDAVLQLASSPPALLQTMRESAKPKPKLSPLASTKQRGGCLLTL